MSTVTTPTPYWMRAEELKELGFTPGGPEIDYGMRWGEQQCVRVSYAPHIEHHDGYLYAYDGANNRYLLLAAHTTPHAVEAAWQELTACTATPDAYLAFAALDEQPLPVAQARALLLHCAEQEFAAYRNFTESSNDSPVRFDAAHAVVVHRSARVAAEQILVESANAADPEDTPVLIRYRVTDENSWAGRVAGPDLDSAADTLRGIDQLGQQHNLTVQATSVTQGHATVAAARVDQLDFVRAVEPLRADVPRLAL